MDLRVGVVAQVDTARCACRVRFDDLQDLVSGWLPALQRGAGAFQTYSLPNIGDQVLCGFLGNGAEQGFILGAFFNDVDAPAESGAGVHLVKFPDGSQVKWDNGALEITAAGDVAITGDVGITGDLEVTGNIHATGSITAPDIHEA